MNYVFCFIMAGVFCFYALTKIASFTLPAQQYGHALLIVAALFMCTGILIKNLETFFGQYCKDKKNKKSA